MKFNYVFVEHNILPTDNFTDNLPKLLNLHKKNKDILFIDIVFYFPFTPVCENATVVHIYIFYILIKGNLK